MHYIHTMTSGVIFEDDRAHDLALLDDNGVCGMFSGVELSRTSVCEVQDDGVTGTFSLTCGTEFPWRIQQLLSAQL